MNFRPLQAADEPLIRQWLASYLAEHQGWWAQGYGREPSADLTELVKRDWHEIEQASQSSRQLVAVLETGNQAVGVVRAGLRTDQIQGFVIGVLQWIYVDAERRGQGLADRLMAHALAWMDAQNVCGREVFVTAHNRAAIRLYKRHGFQVADYRMLARVGPVDPDGS